MKKVQPYTDRLNMKNMEKQQLDLEPLGSMTFKRAI